MKGFLMAMKYKLYVHSNKGNFRHKSNEVLMAELRTEVKELEEALNADMKSERIIAECADIANYAYFIADKQVKGIK